MPVGVRHLKVLGEFKPFGLVAEALDGKTPSNDVYDYFLFGPELTAQRDAGEVLDASLLSDRSDHELFISGNRITWTTGSRVHKRFTLPSPVNMACWSRLGIQMEPFLCVLQIDSLTIFSISGEEASLPLPRTITSIWPLPFGLLLQQEAEGNSQIPSFPCGRDISRGKREFRYSPRHSPAAAWGLDNVTAGHRDPVSSHLIVKDPLEEPQSTFIEERGKLNIMKEFDEKTIWTSSVVPLMASYNKGKMQHSLWVAESISPDLEVASANLSEALPIGVFQKQISFRRIWQGKGAQTAASKVFLATDDDAAPIICFLLQEQKKLLILWFHTTESNKEIIFDIKPDMSWSIPAIAAEPVIVTRPCAKAGQLAFGDIIVLASENTLLLYSGKQCLCRYILPPGLGSERISKNLMPLETTSSLSDLKIVGLSDAVDGRVNVVMNNGQILRCVLRRSPSSSLANDCLTVMADGLSFSFYTYFLALLWGDSAYLSEEDASTDSEWESYSSIILRMCKKHKTGAKRFPDSISQSSWDFLVNSDFHKNYCNASSIGGDSTRMTLDLQQSDSRGLYNDIIRSPDEAFNYEILAQILETLHAVYESMKLDNRRKRDLGLLVILLCNIADYLGEVNYLDHYVRDFPDLSKKFEVRTSSSGRHPPSLFRWIESSLLYGCNVSDTNDLPPLICKDEYSVLSWARQIVSFYSLLCGAKPSGKNLSSGVSCKISSGSSSNSEELTVLAMVGEQFGLPQLDLLPAGVSLPLRHALDNCRESPPTDWPASAYILLGREDLGLSHADKFKELEVQSNLKLISMSTPYMLHLHPVAVPSSFSDTNGTENIKFDDADCVDGSMVDGMEHIFNSNMQLQYGRDLRLNEVRRLLCSARPVAIQTSDNPTASDQDLQQAQLWQLAQRTTALPLGRGAFTLATTSTLLTEALTVPKLVLAGRLPAQQNATVNLDPSIRNIPELKSWPEFHNAVAAGLRLSHLQGKISRTWIMYNKPEEPNVVHAGLLLSLGLHRHLHVLTITDIYQYFSQEHENTTVGLMLGLAASYRGTMQPAISKCLYLHIPARHPSSFPELELPTLMQSAALMSVGLLYEGSAHPQTMQNLLAEIGRRSGGDNVLEREGYAVSAGFSLGLVALGRGEDALGFMDAFVERLFQYVGGKATHNERSLPFNVSADYHHRGVGQMMDGTLVNIDVTAPGAIIALALMFLKTESELAISRLSIPSTHFELQYVRPDFIMLRVIARNLIMWNRVHASKEWIHSQIPEVVQNGISGLGDEEGDMHEIDVEAVVQAYVNILAGSCISIGLRFAGTKDGRAQELLYEYALYFLNEIKAVSVRTGNTFPKGLSHYVDRGTLEVMAGSGNLRTFRLLRFLRSRNSADGHANYGTQMAVSLAIGFLFLGGGMRTFSTSNSSIAALLITLYPRLPTGPNDNRCHLQAFRHLYVLATEARWIQTVDVDSGLPVYAPLEVTLKETQNYGETNFLQVTPCILPERVTLKTVRVCGPRYWPQVIDLVPEEKPWWGPGDNNDPFNSGVLYIKRKVGACSYVDDPIGCQSLLSRAMHKVFGLTSLKASAPSTSDCIGAGPVTIDQLVSTFSSDPSLIAFAQLCCDSAWNSRSDPDFQEFCLQVLFECVSKDRPALLQVYLSLYTTLQCMADEVAGGASSLSDTFFISSLKLALAYNEALLRGRLVNSRGGIVQSAFLGSLRKRVEELLRLSPDLQDSFQCYLKSGRWIDGNSQEGNGSVLLSWYLQWYSVPSPSAIGKAVEKIKLIPSSSAVPLLRLLMPRTHISAIEEIQKGLFST